MRLIVSLVMLLPILLLNTCSREEKDMSAEQVIKTRDFVQISLSSSNLYNSLNFYKTLGFKEVEVHSGTAVPWAMISDGFHIFMVSQNNFPSPALTYYEKKFKDHLEILQSNGLTIQYIPSEAGRPWTAVLSAPSGIGITLIDLGGEKLPGTDIRDSLIIGKFTELSIPVPDITTSLSFWRKVGFEVTGQTDVPTNIIGISDGKINLGLYQTDSFKTIALTYAAENLHVVKDKLKSLGVKFRTAPSKKMDYPGSIAVISPDNQLIFIREKTQPL